MFTKKEIITLSYIVEDYTAFVKEAVEDKKTEGDDELTLADLKDLENEYEDAKVLLNKIIKQKEENEK